MSENESDTSRAPVEPPAAPRADDNRLSSRAVIVGLLIVGGLLLGMLAGLQIFVADRTPELTGERLEEAMELWEENAPDSYAMEIDLRGAQPGTVEIEVNGGVVRSMTRDGREPPQRTWDVWSVPGMFVTLERELQMAEDPQHEMDVAAGTRLQLRCEFDERFGFPRRYHRFATSGAPEIFWDVVRFEAR